MAVSGGTPSAQDMVAEVEETATRATEILFSSKSAGK